jgi:hypothetical protein
MSKYLDKKEENILVSLGNRKYYITLLLTVLWIAFVIVFFVVFMVGTDRSFSDSRNYVILFLCVLPFFPFSVQKVLLSKNFYATVSYAVHTTQFESLKNASGIQRPERVASLEVIYKKDDGKQFTVVYKKTTYPMGGLCFSEGDRVFFARGLKYPFKLPMQENEEYTCPVCGKTIEAGLTVCTRCRSDFSKISNK